MLLMWTGGQVSLRVGNVTWTDLDPLAFILHLCNHFCIASRLVCSFCQAMPGSLSVANTAVLSGNVAVVYSVHVGRSAVYRKYNSGHRTAFTKDSSVYSDSNFMRKCSLCR
jgi:hypothetical protein